MNRAIWEIVRGIAWLACAVFFGLSWVIGGRDDSILYVIAFLGLAILCFVSAKRAAKRASKETEFNAALEGAPELASDAPTLKSVPEVHGYSTGPAQPVRVDEDAPGHMALKTNWTAKLPVLLFLLISFLLVGVGVFCYLYYLDPVIDQRGGRQPLLVGGALFAYALGIAILSTLVPMVIMVGAIVKEFRRRGPIDFDRDGGCVWFGPVAAQQSRPLKEIAAFELYPVSSVTLNNAILDASSSTKKTPSWMSSIFRWLVRLGAKRCYQLDLVYCDGARLYLTFGKKPEPIEAMGRQLAEFVRVPLIEKTSDGCLPA